MSSRIGTAELVDMLIAFVVLTVAFSFMLSGVSLFNMAVDRLTPEIFFIAAVGVGSGFLLHELAHKFTAMRYGYYAEFRTSMNGLLWTIGSALIGFLFAIPGAVYIAKPQYATGDSTYELKGNPEEDAYWDGISRRRGDDKELKISVAGPVTNLVIAAFFFALVHMNVLSGLPFYAVRYGIVINLILAAFNMLPIPPLDGEKVFRSNPTVWVIVGAPAIILGLAAMTGIIYPFI